ncbi:short chain dehydrogenase [Purpureocillium lilacinum]|uniref:Short chain dehydrogenase n=1 Tax=Purpureocillium lilacinum TaxID=33203 RepID=A0A179GCR0_PURLI|nr:short chain dehydrogenase [Purpureocillium lilacinum]OAQ74939.1 short chain dehydrogenase [Purpureocillium lilacinum]OAQ83052.1 short chain dehydrogenase [Purpureocillium lilacinum]GJN70643.1 hypothetical protein PLICBS_004701 [Purpureocillium lilacinum]
MAVVLVTGANRGIGLAIAQSITARLPNDTVILGCRTLQSGQDAIERLQAGGIGLKLDVVEIDIESDSSIATAVAAIERKYGRLDVLVNNAIKLDVSTAEGDLPSARAVSNACFNNGITSNAIVTRAFTPLLRKSANPRVVMVSSTRGSMGRTASRQLPPVAVVDYCIVKAGLNMLTLHLQAAEDNDDDHDGETRITFWAVSPGHCKTGFNGFRGTKDPLDGAEVVLRLLESQAGEIPGGTFWEYEGGEFRMPPW